MCYQRAMENPVAGLVTPEAHRAAVTAIQQLVRARPDGKRLSVKKATPSHVLRDTGYKREAHRVDISALDGVLAVDAAALTARIQGTMTMGALVDFLLPLGLVPAVTPEIPRFTVSGLINGEGLETSSHRYGVFSDALREVELVLGDGSLLVASEHDNVDFFIGLRESQGTVGIVTAATIRVAPAKAFVLSTYRRFDTVEAYLAALRTALVEDADDFIEGVLFAADFNVLITSRFVAEAPADVPEYHPTRDGERYYFQHVRHALRADAEARDVVPTREYLFRAERGFFWLTEAHVGVPPLTGTEWGRRFVDKKVREAYESEGFGPHLVSEEVRNRHLVYQDLGVALDRVPEIVRWIGDNIGVYPLWNCPIRLMTPEHLPALPAAAPGAHRYLVDVGVYGAPTVKSYRAHVTVAELQRKVDFPSLWGPIYLGREELAGKRGFDLAAHDELRARYHANGAFAHLYDKITWAGDTAPAAGGPSSLWRLERDFGPKWYKKPGALLTLAVGFMVVAPWKIYDDIRESAAARKRKKAAK